MIKLNWETDTSSHVGVSSSHVGQLQRVSLILLCIFFKHLVDNLESGKAFMA